MMQRSHSTTDGKVTKYAYDAAGRLVKEGDKVYSYGWLDKIVNVQENGTMLASFDYHINGQIAAATRNGKTENFFWDGLALIHRDGTNYMNEPYVTGGNPILADNKVLFNDILGTTLGSKEGEKFSSIQRDAFGMLSSEQSAKPESSDNFFTGKPFIGELGYSFLFRNYRAEQGKWNSQDPITLAAATPMWIGLKNTQSTLRKLGYPNGWNNLAYCNNSVLIYTDNNGCAYSFPATVLVSRTQLGDTSYGPFVATYNSETGTYLLVLPWSIDYLEKLVTQWIPCECMICGGSTCGGHLLQEQTAEFHLSVPFFSMIVVPTEEVTDENYARFLAEWFLLIKKQAENAVEEFLRAGTAIYWITCCE